MSRQSPWRLNVRLGPLQFLQGVPGWLVIAVGVTVLLCCCCGLCVGGSSSR